MKGSKRLMIKTSQEDEQTLTRRSLAHSCPQEKC